ncbi:Response regulator receiver domain-containing protein [Paucidesulfovibrio gracilis DSM 16080]|uniref:Response regulator receiver domain-containing protein n=1 Tax=Paucidesulfovibrio gracilis DSM 16080 TaxID=1121449 RepID=A0A1T4W132_9BACT|nr:response regulator [Paucidesulfovibrio gracilis]SKA70943.1 Response regulator receiver domain-containing protein [Paucidesulfovibrio gracilis DSM 16080]
MKIMIVDDEQRLLYTTKKLFSKIGIDVLTASSGEDALRLLESETVHVVFLDIKMPGMDGLKVLKEIKKINPMIEVIMLTGHASLEAAVEGIRLGAADYLIKPVSMKSLLGKSEEAFERRKKLEEKICLARSRNVVRGD